MTTARPARILFVFILVATIALQVVSCGPTGIPGPTPTLTSPTPAPTLPPPTASPTPSPTPTLTPPTPAPTASPTPSPTPLMPTPMSPEDFEALVEALLTHNPVERVVEALLTRPMSLEDFERVVEALLTHTEMSREDVERVVRETVQGSKVPDEQFDALVAEVLAESLSESDPSLTAEQVEALVAELMQPGPGVTAALAKAVAREAVETLPPDAGPEEVEAVAREAWAVLDEDLSVAEVWSDPPAELYNQLLAKEERSSDEIEAVFRWKSLDWFADSCKAGTLPKVSGGNFHTKVIGKGRVNQGSRTHRLLPRIDFTAQSDLDQVYLHTIGSGLSFGLYCIEVSDTILARLSCPMGEPYNPCDRPGAWIFPPGRSVVVVSDSDPRAMSEAVYHLEMRCARRVDDCGEGYVDAIYFSIPSYTEVKRALSR